MQKKRPAIGILDILLGELVDVFYGLKKLQPINQLNKIQMVNTLDKHGSCWLGNEISCIAVMLYL